MESPSEKVPPEVITPDTKNATFFNPDESNTEQRFKLLRFYHRGTWKDRRTENKKVRHRQDNLAIYDALSSQLTLTDWQKKKGRRIFDGLDLQLLGKSARLVAFGVCILVANDDVVDGTRYWPNASDTDEEFTQIKDNLDFRDSQVLSIISLVDRRRSE